MNSLGKFREAYGQGEQYRSCEPGDRSQLEGLVPDFLLELWTADGWAGYRGGLLWTVDPRDFQYVVSAWDLPRDPGLVIARTAFGSLYMLSEFLVEEGLKEISVVEFDPHMGDYMVAGPVAKRFLVEELAKSEYIKNVLREVDVKRALHDVGPLAWDEMYGYEPALALGGSGEPEGVRRYNIFNHHLMLSQLVEVAFQSF